MKSLTAFLALLAIAWIPLAAQTPLQLTAAEGALLDAALLGKLGEVERLLSEGTAVDTVDSEKHTPLMFAAFNGHTAVVAYLREHGAETNAKDINGRTPLMYASSGPFAETVKLLLRSGLPETRSRLLFFPKTG